MKFSIYKCFYCNSEDYFCLDFKFVENKLKVVCFNCRKNPVKDIENKENYQNNNDNCDDDNDSGDNYFYSYAKENEWEDWGNAPPTFGDVDE